MFDLVIVDAKKSTYFQPVDGERQQQDELHKVIGIVSEDEQVPFAFNKKKRQQQTKKKKKKNRRKKKKLRDEKDAATRNFSLLL